MKIKKVYFSTRQAFTLIELLIVIAIIGILSSVILVSMGNARGKAKDASIISSANSLMKAAQVSSLSTGNYFAWGGSNGTSASSWSLNTSEINGCDSQFLSTPDVASAQAACRNILKTQGEDTSFSAKNIWVGSWYPAMGPRLTIMVWLPSVNKYYCIGSSGGSAVVVNDGWFSPNSGCVGDPAANGS